MTRKFVFAVLLLPFLFGAASVQAIVRNWTGATSANWSEPSNWSPAGLPAAADSLVFPTGAPRLSMTNDLPAGTTVGAMTFNDNYTLSGNALTLSGDLSFRQDYYANVNVTFNNGFILANAVTIGSAANNYNGAIDVNGQTLTIDESRTINSAAALNGPLNGTGTVNVVGSGLYVTGSGTFHGTINGTLNVSGSLPDATINGRLTGAGSVGTTTAGEFSPGNESPWKTFGYDDAAGVLHTKALTLTSGARFDLAAGGTSDQVRVTGAVSIAGPLTVDLLSGAPVAGQLFTLIDNDGADAVTGTFSGLPEGAAVTLGTATLALSYHGGDGNDVVLTTISAQKTWTGAVSGLWSDPHNWTPQAVPGGGEKLLFPAGVSRLAMTNDLPDGTPVGALTFNDNYTLTGNVLALGGDLIFQRSVYDVANVSVTLSAGLKLTAPVTFGSAPNSYNGLIDVNGQTLTIDESHTQNSTASLNGPLNGSGTVAVAGPGIYIAGSGTFSGTINGTANVSGSLPNATVNGRLTGTGSVGTTTAGQFSPGNESPWKTFGYDDAAGVLQTKSLVLTSGARFDLAPGGVSDQVHVTGTVAVSGPLTVDFLSGAPVAGQAFTLIDNDGSDPVSGIFDGLPEGATVTVGTATLALSYHGGDGNDVVLTAFTAQKSWTGAVSGNWSDARNWAPQAVPAAGENLIFPAGVSQLAMTNDLPVGTTAGAMTFNDNYTLSGNALNLSGNLSFGHDSFGYGNVAVTFNAPLKLASAVTFGSARNYYGSVDVNGQTLTIDESLLINTAAAVGQLNGAGTVNIPGPGIYITGTGTFHGTIAGTVNVSGSLPDATINGRLTGNGTVGNATAGLFSPGDESPWKTFGYDNAAGNLSTKSLVLTGTTRFDLIPGTGLDVVHVTGTVTVGGALALDILSGAPAPGETFTLIDNDGSDPVTGTFTGLPEGATITVGKYTFALTYHGGDGNDVVVVNNTPPELPGAPLNLTATAGEAQATLHWQPPVVSGTTPITGYRVYRQFSAGNQPVTSGGCANLGVVLTCTDTGLVGGQTYVYTVGAFNAAGQGPVSNAATVTPVAGCSLSCSASVPATASTSTPVSFAATATPANCSGDVTYSWLFGDGASSQAPAASHTYAQAGSYEWTLTTTAAGQTCTRTGTIVVGTATCQLGCSAVVPDHGTAGESLSFAATATPANCPGDVTYAWVFGDGSTSSLTSPLHTYDHPGSYDWSLTVSGGDQSCQRSGRINIDNRCTIACSATVPASALVNASVSFSSATTVSCGAPFTTEWDFGDGVVDFLAQTSHVYKSVGSFTWHFTSRHGNADVCTKTGTITIGIPGDTPPPAVNLFVATPPEIAEGTASLLTWATSNTTSVTIDGSGEVPFTGSLRVTPHATTTYHLTASSNGVSVSATATVIVDPPFHAESHGAPLSGVVPFTTSFGVVASGGTPPYTYQWTTGETAALTTHRWTEAGQFDVNCTVTDSHGLTTSTPLLHVTATAQESGLALEILDQTPAFLHDTVHRSGAAADGVTLLLLRATAAVPGSVTFTMNGHSGAAQDGGLLTFPGTSGNPASTLTVTLTGDGHGAYSASATYKVPEDFNDGNSETLGERPISFNAHLTGDNGTADAGPLNVSLVRPPLVFIHGLWSGPDPAGAYDDTWAGFPLTRDTRFTVVKAVWDGTGSIAGQKQSVGNAIGSALLALQSRGIAASRADVITHSMGGLLARAWVHDGHDVIHKLITLNTPHDGSAYATWLYGLVGCGAACDAIDSLFTAAGLPLDRGAIADLREGAASRIDAIDTPGLRAHALVGLASLDEPCFSQRSSVLKDLQDYAASFLGTAWSFAEQNDEVVGAASQSGGIPASENVRGCTSAHWNVTSNSGTFAAGSTHPGLAYSDRLFQLLNSSVAGGEFGVFPRPSAVARPVITAALHAPAIAAAPSTDLAIASPAAGQVVAPGAVVSVWVDAPATATGVTVAAPGQFVRASGPPWVAAIRIPDTANGPWPLVAAANVAGILNVSGTVTLAASPTGAPARLTVDPLQLYAGAGGTAQVTVFGVFPDGVARNVTNGSGTTYESLDPSIATVDANGRITGLRPGMTSIRVQNGAVEATLLVTVTGGNSRRRAVEH
jgi:PKD repeat protein